MCTEAAASDKRRELSTPCYSSLDPRKQCNYLLHYIRGTKEKHIKMKAIPISGFHNIVRRK